METIDTLACEFGYEIIMVVPYANYLYRNGQDVTVITSRGMRVFYHFLPAECVVERYNRRTWVEPHSIGVPLKTIHFPRLAANERGVHFSGRLGSYRYMDMDKTIRQAMDFCRNITHAKP